MSDAKFVMNLGAVALRTEGDRGRFQFEYSRIGPDIGMAKLGCGLFVVPPGKSAVPYHAHSTIEELYIVLEGEGTFRHNGTERPIRTGDVIASPVGQAHQIANTSDNALRYLAISNNESVDVVHYPDSDKILAASDSFGAPLRHITRRGAGVDYYDGEGE